MDLREVHCKETNAWKKSVQFNFPFFVSGNGSNWILVNLSLEQAVGIHDYSKRYSNRTKIQSELFILKNLTHPVCIACSRLTHALHSPFSGPPKIQVLSP